jgi:hypothetical protein
MDMGSYNAVTLFSSQYFVSYEKLEIRNQLYDANA